MHDELTTINKRYYLSVLMFIDFHSRVVELVDTLDLGSNALKCVGSSPISSTKFFLCVGLYLVIIERGLVISLFTEKLSPLGRSPKAQI